MPEITDGVIGVALIAVAGLILSTLIGLVIVAVLWKNSKRGGR